MTEAPSTRSAIVRGVHIQWARSVGLVALVLGAGPARAADTAGGQSPYEVDVGRDLAIAATVGLVSGLPRVLVDELVTPWCGLWCDPESVPSFDQVAIGNDDPTAGLVSDVTYIGLMTLPHALGALDVAATGPSDGWAGYGTDTVVILQTLSLALGSSNAVNFLIRRPRPYVYDRTQTDARRLDGIGALSFYSGHTTAAFSMSTAYARLFMLRHPRSWLVVPTWVLASGLAATTGVLRVVAGDHFPSDVLVGAVTGIGWGLFVPWTHEVGRDRGSARRAALGPLYVEGGFGAAIRIR